MSDDADTQPRRRKRGAGRAGGDGAPVVPDAVFTSYYGRPVVKPSPWRHEIPAYLFLGGLAGGSSLLAAGADLTGRPALRRTGRLAAAGGITLSLLALVRDLGKPSRFLNMMRVLKPTSPMSVGTWILTLFGPLAGAAAAAEAPLLTRLLPAPLSRLITATARPAGLAAAVVGPTVASYTGVLLADTATPAWSSARRELPFLFACSAAAASGGLGMVCTPVAEAAPARRLALAGAVADLAVEARMETSMGLAAETLHHGTAGRLSRWSKGLTVSGALVSLAAGRSRVAAVAAGAALMAGSACTRFAIFEAGQHSATDPKYTVVPQRERLDAAQNTAARSGSQSGSIIS